MKSKIRTLLAAALIMPVVSIAPALAHPGHYHESQPQVASSTDEQPAKTREERVAERKAKTEKRLTQLQQAAVKGRCQFVKGLVTSVKTRVTLFEERRPHVYENAVKKLEALGPKLQAAGVDVTEYNKQVAELKTRLEVFDEDVANLKLAVEDLAATDCSADPEGFVATAREVLELRQNVIDEGRAVRTYLKDTVRPTLKQIKTQLQAKKEGEE